nr:nickel/cobalt transporter [uncultured Cohaesibacter sp.]
MQVRAAAVRLRLLPGLVVLLAVAFWLLAGHSAFAAGSPFGVAIPDTTGPLATGGIWGDIQGWILARQSDFYLALKDTVKQVQSNPAALALLLGLSFAYGVFHAAGPGHGKVVLTTYLFASGATARRGALLAFIAAMVQASVAVILIGVAAVALNLTAMAITQTAQLLELGSYALFVLLGGWLLLRAWKGFAEQIKAGAVSDVSGQHHGHTHDHDHDHHHAHDHHAHHHHHHHHDHDEACGCGHSHAPSIETVEQVKGLRGMVLAVVSMGLRPCSGALIVLVFALSQKVFWAGVLSAYAMGAGTGLTIAILALIAVYARRFSQGLVGRGLSSQWVNWFGVLLLAVGGVAVMGFGLVLLLANLL